MLWWIANSKRDIEKQKEPFPVADFYLYGPPVDGAASGPPPAAGAAMLALLESDQCPGYVLSFHDALERAGRDASRPAMLALIAEDAILLAPKQGAEGWTGFLVLERSAAGQSREFVSDDGNLRTVLSVPAPATAGAVSAVGSACLPSP